jgi:O-antigen/teichoic acid export membrane protein
MTFYVSSQFSFLIGVGEQTKCYLLQGALQLLTSLLLFLSFLARSGVWAIPLASGFAALLLFLPLRAVLRSRLKDLPLFVLKPLAGYKELFLGVWRPALDSLMSTGWSMLTFSLDAILVGLLVGPGQAAIYGVLSRLTGISRHFLQALGETAWPRLAQATHPERKAELMRKIDRLNAWNVGTWFGAMFATIVPFLGWFLKADWVAGELLVALVLVRHGIISLAGPHVFGITSLGLFREGCILSRREVIASAIPAVIFSHYCGTIGIASGYLLGTCIVSGWQITRVYFCAQKQPWLSELGALYLRYIVGTVLAYTIGTSLWHLCRAVGPAPGWLAAVVGAVAFAASWGATAGLGILKQSRATDSRANQRSRQRSL